MGRPRRQAVRRHAAGGGALRARMPRRVVVAVGHHVERLRLPACAVGDDFVFIGTRPGHGKRRREGQLPGILLHRVVPRRAARLRLALLQRHLRALRELRRLRLLRARGEVKRTRLGRGKRHHPVRPQEHVAQELPPLHDNAVVVDIPQHALATVARREVSHHLERVARGGRLALGRGVLVAERLALVVGEARVAQRARAHGREGALPDRALVRQRVVRVAREGHRVRIGREDLRDEAGVVPPRPRAVARVLRVRVLEVEERPLRIERLPVRVQETLELDAERAAAVLRLHPLPVVPVLAEERVALDHLAVEARVVLVEDLLPPSGQVAAQHVVAAPGAELALLRLLRMALRGVVAVEVAVVVVVAVDEELLDLPAVGGLVVREDRIPGLRDGLQLLDHAVVGHVAHHHHRVHALVAEPFKGMPEREVVAPVLRFLACAHVRDVDVAHHAEREVRLLRGRLARAERADARATQGAERSRATDEETTCQFHVTSSTFPCCDSYLCAS